MTKRMVIMLIAVAVVFGGIFGFQAFKAADDQEIHELDGAAAADRFDRTEGRLTANGSRRSRRSAACARSRARTCRWKSPAWSTRSRSIPATTSKKARRC